MSLKEDHVAIRGAVEEQALVVLAQWTGEGTPTVNTLRKALGQQDGSWVYRELQRLGYLESEVSLGAEAELTPRGRRLSSYILSLRGRGGLERSDAVRRGLLHHLAENDRVMSCADFVGSSQAQAFGTPFTSAEVEEAASWLREHKLMTSIDSWQQPHLRPEILPSGREVLYITDLTIDDYLQRSASGGTLNDYRNYGNHVQGNVGAIQQGDHNSATVNQILNDDHRQLVLAKVAEIEAETSGQADPRLAEHVAAIRAEAEMPEPVKEKLLAKAALALATALGSAAGTSAGQQVVPGLQQLIQIITG